jgi:hypothetical protein
MTEEPIARGALRGGNLGVRHLIRDLAPQSHRFAVAFNCREIEPLMRRDEIDRHIAPDRIHDAKFEEHVACGRSLAERRHICIQHFQVSHRSPCSRRITSASGGLLSL